MPWDGSELCVGGARGDATLENVRQVAGRAGEESIFQPAWSPAGDLHFVSDRTGWWNLYRERDGEVQALHPAEAEFGWPQWRSACPRTASSRTGGSRASGSATACSTWRCWIRSRAS